MSEEFTTDDLAAATQEWVEAAEACRRWRGEHITCRWPESGESPPPEPKVVTRQSLDEYQRLLVAEEKAYDRWRKVNGGLLGMS